ncbi:MAG TPA: cytochrome C oxidase subunit IV family protein [Patescibacteria group bacterium]|nr:cytochrome C oxidase subunit IV family protein [Patescibacteria group bacterium]
MSGHDPAEVDRHVRVYIVVFVSLMALTLVTVAVSYLHLPLPMAIAVALAIASVKGSLVACYFMHLISEKKLIIAILALTVFMFLTVLFIPTFTHMNSIELHG